MDYKPIKIIIDTFALAKASLNVLVGHKGFSDLIISDQRRVSIHVFLTKTLLTIYLSKLMY